MADLSLAVFMVVATLSEILMTLLLRPGVPVRLSPEARAKYQPPKPVRFPKTLFQSEVVMTKLQEEAQGQVKQAVGQLVGDDKLVVEGKKQQRSAERKMRSADQGITKDQKGQDQPKHKKRAQNVDKKTRDPATRKGPVLE
jgi:uncharacterized protein YjbJ (UPF0337 family)